jgi:hypothetical protein
MDDNSEHKIHKDYLASVPAISTLGLLATKMLATHNIVTLMIDKDGFVQLVPQGELELDSLPEPTALSTLIATGYTDEQLTSYLQQRNQRYLDKCAKEATSGNNL